MNKNKFIIQLLLFTLLLGAIYYGLMYVLPENYFSPVLPFLFPFFFASTALVYSYLDKSSEQKFNRFVNRFMLTTFVKLMIFMAVLLIYVFTHKEDAVPFILSFFIMYVAYTAFEVVALLKFSNSEKKQ
jgi:L-asparagine transporter-like permease